MAKKLTKAKAREILHDKSVHGQPLTDKQRRFFGAIAGGAEPYKAQNGFIGPIEDESGETDFLRKWMDSPKYKEMLTKSTISPEEFKTIASGRLENINRPYTKSEIKKDDILNQANVASTNILYSPRQYANPFIPGSVDRPSEKIGFDVRYSPEKFASMSPLERASILIHERSHTSDMDFYDPHNSQTLVIPSKDRALIGSRDNLTGYLRYLKNPTEVRARLNELRFLGKDLGVYDPFNESINLEQLKQLNKKIPFSKTRGASPYEELQELYTPEEIVNLLNSVSKVSTGDINQAKNGIEGTMGGLTDKGFNFNPAWGGAWRNGGWLDKYADGGNLQPPMAGANQTVPMAQTGTRQTIYTSDLDRVKSYQDSVSLYNQGKANYDRGVRAYDKYVASLPLEHQQYYTKQPSYEQAPSRLYTLTGKDLEKYLKEENFRSGLHRDFSDKFFLKNRNNPIKPTHLQVIEGIVNQAFYKKPVERVEYRKRTLERPNLSVDIPEIEFEALPQPDVEYRSAAPIPKMISETPTKYSYTYPTGKYNEQKTIYFPSKSAWKAFTEQFDGLNTEERAGSFSATPGVYTKQRRPNPAFSDLKFAMGGSLPGATGMMYVRTAGAAPSEGPYAKKTLPSAQNGAEMAFYQQGLDWKPKTISRNGGWLDKYNVVKDNKGYWNPENWGKVVEIDSNDITMKGVDQPLIGVSDEGDVKYMEPGKDYKFKGKKVKEYPVGAQGVSVNKADEYPLEKLDNLLNFTNYNKPKAKNGWLEKYK